ncbi:hypothetical protein DFS34DRAFT_625757, partial [Phlyctochytrium arcticum]
MDFLKATRDADMTRVAVGFNPPFGSSCMTAVRFIQHAVKEYEPETICMILPHRATVRDFPGMKVAHKRLLPSKSFHKYATKKVFKYDAFFTIFEKGVSPPRVKLDTRLADQKILAIKHFRWASKYSDKVLVIQRSFRPLKMTMKNDLPPYSTNDSSIAIYFEEDTSPNHIEEITRQIKENRDQKLFYKRSTAIYDIVECLRGRVESNENHPRM